MPIYTNHTNEDHLDRLFGIDDPVSHSIKVCTLDIDADADMDLATKHYNLNRIKKVIFNCPATIVYWVDGTKTIVKCDGEEFDPEKGLAMAIAKKFLGVNQGYYYEICSETCQ